MKTIRVRYGVCKNWSGKEGEERMGTIYKKFRTDDIFSVECVCNYLNEVIGNSESRIHYNSGVHFKFGVSAYLQPDGKWDVDLTLDDYLTPENLALRSRPANVAHFYKQEHTDSDHILDCFHDVFEQAFEKIDSGWRDLPDRISTDISAYRDENSNWHLTALSSFAVPETQELYIAEYQKE